MHDRDLDMAAARRRFMSQATHRELAWAVTVLRMAESNVEISIPFTCKSELSVGPSQRDKGSLSHRILSICVQSRRASGPTRLAGPALPLALFRALYLRRQNFHQQNLEKVNPDSNQPDEHLETL